MHALRKLIFGLIALPAASHAATVVAVTPPAGAVQTIVFGINDHNVIAGSYIDTNNVTHGFVGRLNETYTSFDYGGTSTGTAARALDDGGNIVGFAAGPNLYVGTEFLRQANGTIVTIGKNGVPFDGVAQGIIRKGEESTGDYVIDATTGLRTGYLAGDGVYQTDVDLQLGELTSNPRAINDAGTLAGFYREQNDVSMHGFIFKKGIVEVVNADDSGTTALEGINKKELATGQVIDIAGNPHSFVFNNKTGLFTYINIQDGSQEQQAWGINDKGQIAVSTGIGASYIYCTNDHQCPGGGHRVADGRSWKQNPDSTGHAKAAVRQRSGVLR
jgi:uncharacterized membrane protein